MAKEPVIRHVACWWAAAAHEIQHEIQRPSWCQRISPSVPLWMGGEGTPMHSQW